VGEGLVVEDAGGVAVAATDEGGEVDRAEVANTPLGEPLLAAGVHTDDLLVVPGVAFCVVAVDEDEAGLTGRPRALADHVTELARGKALLDLAVPLEVPHGTGFDGVH